MKFFYIKSIVQPTNRTKHKTKKKNKNQTHKPIQSQNTIKFQSFLAGLTVLLQIQCRNQNRKQLRETKRSLIFHACFSATKQWVQSNSPFSLVLRDLETAVAWSKLAVAWSKLLAKADWDRDWVWLREQWDGGEASSERESVSERASLTLCEVRAWMWECECAWVCEREGEGEGEGQRVQTDLCERVRRYFWI